MKTGIENVKAIMRRRRILFAGFVARMEDTRLPKGVMFVELVGGAGCVGEQEKEWMGCLLEDLRAFAINAHQWTAAAKDEEKWRETAEQGAERFMAKWIAAENVRAGLRHTRYSSMRESDENDQGKDSPKQACLRAGSLAIVDQPQIAQTCILWPFLVCRCRFVFLWRYVCFGLFAFIEAAALRSIFSRYTCAPAATFSQLTTVSLLFILVFVWRCHFFFSPIILYHFFFLN